METILRIIPGQWTAEVILIILIVRTVTVFYRMNRLMLNAVELTPIVQKNKDEIFLMKKRIELLDQEVEKLSLVLSDLKIDVKMMQPRR